MRISENKVVINKDANGSSSRLGYGIVTFDDTWSVLYNIMKAKVSGNIFISWPNYKKNDGTYGDIISWKELETKKSFEEEMCKEVNKQLIGSSTSNDKILKGKDKVEDDTSKSEPEEKKTEKTKRKPLVNWG